MAKKEPIVINYNDKLDKVEITVSRETTPNLFEAKVRYIMKALNKNREDAEKFCEERANWKLPFALVFDDEEGDFFAIYSEYLYSDECRKRSPYTGRPIKISYDFRP